MSNQLKIAGVCLSFFFCLAPSLHAAAPDPTACEGEIRQVCKGLEDQLETCAQERGSLLSKPCRDQLEAALSIAASGAGPGACLPDITRACGNLGEKELAQCISDKKSSFSKSCQDYLAGVQTASNPPDSSQ